MLLYSPRHAATRFRRTSITVATVATLLLVLVIGAVSASASTTGVRSPKPTIVLVHGAFADSGGWNADIAALQRLGYPVIAAPNPLRGLTSDADYLRSLLQTISGPIVLVGHSYGGAVITNAARGVSTVRALVYIGAFVPGQGESIATVPDPKTYPGSLLGPDTITARPFPNPTAPSGVDYDLTIKPADFRAVFAADVPARTAALMAVTQRPLSLTADTEPSGPPAWKTIPSWDLITLDDHAIAPAGQRFMAERAHARIRTVHSSHAVMVSHPDAVVRIIVEAATGY